MEVTQQQVAIEATSVTSNVGNNHHPSDRTKTSDAQNDDGIPAKMIKATPKRYLILALFCLNAANKGFQWIQLAAITVEAARFYQVDNYMINVMAMIYMLAKILLLWPTCFLLNRLGLRRIFLMASLGAAIGSSIKYLSCFWGGIWLLILAQIIVACSEQLVHSLPSRLASVWFPDSQVSSALSMCILGNHLGKAFGFQLPHWLLNGGGESSVEQIGQAIYSLFLFTMVLSVASFLLDYFLFDERPKHAPGVARQEQLTIELAATTSDESKGLIVELKTLLSQTASLFNNSQLMLLVVSYGITYSIGDCLLALLSQTITPIWPGDTQLIGNIGFITILSGSAGLPVWGLLMDKYHHYKAFNIFNYSLSILMMISFACILTVWPAKVGLYLTAIAWGASSAGSMVTSLEQAVELTYPAPEVVTVCLMMISSSIFGILFVSLGSFIVDHLGVRSMIVFFLAALTLALILLICSRQTLNRQKKVIERRCGEDDAQNSKCQIPMAGENRVPA